MFRRFSPLETVADPFKVKIFFSLLIFVMASKSGKAVASGKGKFAGKGKVVGQENEFIKNIGKSTAVGSPMISSQT